MKKRLAIVSSYDESCGNASYTEALKKEFLKHYDVDVLALNVGLLNNQRFKLLADNHIQEMAEKLKNYDYVNIQFEAGLFGRANTVFNRFKILIDSSRNVIVTLHRYDSSLPFFTRGLLHDLVRLKIGKVINHCNRVLSNNVYAKLYKNIVLYCKKKDAAIMVHTQRDKGFLQLNFNLERIYDHPLTFLDKEELAAHKQKASKEKFHKKYNLSENDKVIGLFGFISPHKGYLTAIQAMLYLPDNYKLLVFGSQHPLSITPYQSVNPLIASLIKTIEMDVRKKNKKNLLSQEKTELSLADKIQFCGSLDDSAFINALLCCDMTILPYLEVNQGGSGIAALTLDTGVKAIFSLNNAFIELAKYAKNAFKTFSIGNQLELANAIQNYDAEEFKEGLAKYSQNYTMATNIALHQRIFNSKQ